MSRFNTGNPLGSGSPLDLDDNAKNMDLAVNAPQDTFQDRLGKSRLTWAGIVKAGSGDPAIAVDAADRAVDAADRAESAESSLEQNAEQIAQDAAQQAVDSVVIAVDGAVDRSENAADRAEAASDAAFVNADVYPDIATGRAAVANGEQFQVLSEDGMTYRRYRKDSASVATEVGNGFASSASVAKKADKEYVDETIDWLTKKSNINLLDESASVLGGYFSNTTGEWIVSASYRSSDLIPCAAGDVFSKTISPAIGPIVTFWDEGGAFVSGLSVANAAPSFNVPSNESIAYFRIMIPSSSNKDATMLVKGAVMPDRYVAYDDRMLDVKTDNIMDAAVTADKLSHHLTKKSNINLLDESASVLGGYFNRTDGAWVTSAGYRSSDLIPAEPGSAYARTTTPLVGNHVTFWDAGNNFVTGIDIGLIERFFVPSIQEISYFRINIASSSPINATMVVKGNALPDEYTAFQQKIIRVRAENLDVGSVTKESLSDDLISSIFGDGQYIKPFHPASNPVLTRASVTDRTSVSGVADPFIVMDKGRYHMFFEVIQGISPSTGLAADEIGHAYSDDLVTWTYTQIVVSKEEHGHRSAYPYIFKDEADWYMVPDLVGPLRVMKATNFPLEWERVPDIVTGYGGGFADSNIFEVAGVWYCTTMNSTIDAGISLFVNTSGTWNNTSWTLHPDSPIIPNTAEEGYRGAGNVQVFDGYVLLPIQVKPVATGVYGEYTYLFKIGGLSATEATATNLGKLTSAQYDGGWMTSSSHHASSAEYMAGKKVWAVDGTDTLNRYSIGLFVDE